jgi:hypothetical protein
MILLAKTVQNCDGIDLSCNYGELGLVQAKMATKLHTDWEKELINNM